MQFFLWSPHFVLKPVTGTSTGVDDLFMWHATPPMRYACPQDYYPHWGGKVSEGFCPDITVTADCVFFFFKWLSTSLSLRTKLLPTSLSLKTALKFPSYFTLKSYYPNPSIAESPPPPHPPDHRKENLQTCLILNCQKQDTYGKQCKEWRKPLPTTLAHWYTVQPTLSRPANGYSPEKSFPVTGWGRKLLRTRKLDADKTKSVWQTAMETVLVFMWQRNLLWKTDCWRDWHASQDCPHTHEMYGSKITASPKNNLRKSCMSVNYSQRNAARLKTPQDNYILERLPQ